MYNKPLLPIKLMAPIGLFLLSAGILIKHFAAVPDFIDGFLKGIGIGMIFFSLVYQWYAKRNEA